ncbi:DUF429 domain-containing protein [Vulcanisaeta thermophila]|uniref:DUF429 domain-containing protein n=1 Tax=Vulcanisaeta thermophila TaxID=867917 RepID=UPI000AA7222A|nr:DUF429 domain-containing protein [Vulcanisaeta thermophila]
MTRYVGIDLALPGRRRIGYAVIDAESRTYRTRTMANEGELIQEVLADKPRLVCIDAPLTLPRRGVNRLIEVRARGLGLRLLPPLMGPMRELTLFGIKLAEELRGLGFTVLEVHPTSSLKILGLSREEFMSMIKHSINGDAPRNQHEIDALIASFTCYLHDIKCTESIVGYEGEGELIIPRRGCGHELLREL